MRSRLLRFMRLARIVGLGQHPRLIFVSNSSLLNLITVAIGEEMPMLAPETRNQILRERPELEPEKTQAMRSRGNA
jgi:hypothetical protein